MSTGGRRKPLVRCAGCGSELLQPVRVWTLVDGRCVVARRCPECEARDTVSADPVAVAVWLRRDARVRRRLAAELAAGVREAGPATAPDPPRSPTP